MRPNPRRAMHAIAAISERTGATDEEAERAFVETCGNVEAAVVLLLDTSSHRSETDMRIRGSR